MKDHRIARRPNRTSLLNILAVERVSELNVPAKVVVVVVVVVILLLLLLLR